MKAKEKKRKAKKNIHLITLEESLAKASTMPLNTNVSFGSKATNVINKNITVKIYLIVFVYCVYSNVDLVRM